MVASKTPSLFMSILEWQDLPLSHTSLGPATFESYYHLLQPMPYGAGLTPKEAVHVIQAERDNLELICDIIKKENLDVDLWKGDLVESECRIDTSRRQADSTYFDQSMKPKRRLPLQRFNTKAG